MIKEIRIETEQPLNIFLFIIFLLFVGCFVKREPRADFKDKVLDLIVKHANGTLKASPKVVTIKNRD
jgi:hypothetical protein